LKSCIFLSICFKVFHIFYERNYYDDKLTNFALIHKEQYKWFNILSLCIYLDFFIYNIYVTLSMFSKFVFGVVLFCITLFYFLFLINFYMKIND